MTFSRLCHWLHIPVFPAAHSGVIPAGKSVLNAAGQVERSDEEGCHEFGWPDSLVLASFFRIESPLSMIL